MLPVYSFVDMDIIMVACTDVFDTFHSLSCYVLSSLIRKLNKTTYLSSIHDNILCIMNLCFSSGVFPETESGS